MVDWARPSLFQSLTLFLTLTLQAYTREQADHSSKARSRPRCFHIRSFIDYNFTEQFNLSRPRL